MDNPRHQQIAQECDRIKEILIAKNAAYGDSAIKPLRIFSKASAIEAINVRLDDKLSRIVRGDGTGDEDAELDLIGYLILKRITLLEGKPEHVLDMAPGDGITTIQRKQQINDIVETLAEEMRAWDKAQEEERCRQIYLRLAAEKEKQALFDSSGNWVGGYHPGVSHPGLNEAPIYSSEEVEGKDRYVTGSDLNNLPTLEEAEKAMVDGQKRFEKSILDGVLDGTIGGFYFGYQNQVKDQLDEVARKINEAVNPPTGTLTGEPLDAIEAEMKKVASTVEMIDGKPYYLGIPYHVHEVGDTWDRQRMWEKDQIVRWRGRLWRMYAVPRCSTAPPHLSGCWTLLVDPTLAEETVIEEVPDEWDEKRSWEPGSVIRWRGRLWIMRSKLKQSYTLSPGRSVCWKSLSEPDAE